MEEINDVNVKYTGCLVITEIMTSAISDEVSLHLYCGMG